MGHIVSSAKKQIDAFGQAQRDLKACPFCGFEASFVQIEDCSQAGGWVKPGWTVCCLDEECYAGDMLRTWKSWSDAAREWNKRV
jgi:hypothetical protein